MSDISKSYKREILDRLFSSKRKILKFIGLICVPIVYAFICIFAFWNPFQNIGKIPIAIVSLDKPADATKESLVDDFMNDWKNNASDTKAMGLTYDEKTQSYCAEVSDTIFLKNIKYINTDTSKYANFDETTKKWTVAQSEYFSEIDFPPNFTDNILNPGELKGSINKYISYQYNFMSGEILTIGSDFVLDAMLNNLFSTIGFDIGSLINTDIPNQGFGIYGMGIGQMFLCIGMWVGAFGMIMVLDRHRRVKKISTRKWYFSKSLVMGTISVIQSSLLMLSICGLGFYKLGTYFPLEWLMILFAGLIFIIIIQAIWYSFRDKSIASFIIVVFLILNICCGGGTFPAFMLNPLFMVLSYIMPFTYLIHAQGAIIYGLSAGVNIFSNWMMVLQSCGILLIFPIVFFLWGLFISRRREREIFYGSCNKKDVLHSLQLLHMDKKYLNIKGELDWKKLPKEIMPKVVELTLSNHPYEKKFKWFEKYRKEIEKDSLNVED